MSRWMNGKQLYLQVLRETYDLAVSYELGKGIPKSLTKAFALYLRAAKGGDRQAQSETGRCFFYGIGTAKDLCEAFKWYKAAATRGDTDAQYALARAYELGDGVDKDIRKAMRWYAKAAACGHKKAKHAIKDLTATVRHAS